MEHTKAYQEFKKNGNTKFVRYSEGAEMYHMSVSKFMQMATPIVFVGGGAVVMKNFGSHDAKNISYNLDVKANARGYEQLATMGLKSTKRLS